MDHSPLYSPMKLKMILMKIGNIYSCIKQLLFIIVLAQYFGLKKNCLPLQRPDHLDTVTTSRIDSCHSSCSDKGEGPERKTPGSEGHEIVPRLSEEYFRNPEQTCRQSNPEMTDLKVFYNLYI